jgi:tetratricopeptide (TPR) repeat protein
MQQVSIDCNIIRGMRRFFQPDMLVRLFVVLLLVPLLGISTRPHIVTLYLQEGKLAENFNSYLSASLSISKVASFHPWRADLWEKAGLLALRGNDHQATLELLEKAALLDGLSGEAQVAMGDAYFQAGDITNAIQQWQKVQDVEGNVNPDIINRLLQAHQRQNDYSAMAADIKELIIFNPNQASLYYQLGLIMAAIEPDSALAYLEQAASLDPQLSSPANTLLRSINTARLADEPAYSYLLAGRALASLDEWELAVEAFHQATLARPDFSEGWAFLGEARQHLPTAEEKISQSLIELEKAYLLNPQSLAANSFLALYWQRLEEPELALEYLETAASLDPSNPAFQAEIGNILANMGNLPDALDAYQKAIDLAPKEPIYWRALAEFAISHQIQLEELALPAAQKAYELDPLDPSSMVVLGKIYYFLEEYDLAQEYLEDALEINPNFPQTHLQIGLNYLVQGDFEQAAQSLQQARELAPDSAISETVDRLFHQYFP